MDGIQDASFLFVDGGNGGLKGAGELLLFTFVRVKNGRDYYAHSKTSFCCVG